MTEKCVECGWREGIKQGWTNSMYCSESCERSSVSRLHGSMPGAGRVPYRNWVPGHISIEISKRWEEVNND